MNSAGWSIGRAQSKAPNYKEVFRNVKKFLYATLLILLVALCTGCANEEVTLKHISQNEAKEIIAKNPNAVIVDVRTAQEYESRHIAKAVLLPLSELRKKNFDPLPFDKDVPILIYCWTGVRTGTAADIIIQAGYRNVYDFGGIVDWTGDFEGEEISGGYQHISQDAAAEIIAKNPNAILADVRFQENYDKEHIAGAVFVPLEDVLNENFSKIPDKNAPIITYCGNGNRARKTAKALVEKGYTNVYEMGGINDWTGDTECAEEVDKEVKTEANAKVE